jgi:uncharacterized repeat protein (TIGR03803 family)
MTMTVSSFVKTLGTALVVTAMLLSSSSAAPNFKVLYNFTGANDGGNPATGLIFDNTGNAYGTTVTGGQLNCGTVFELTPAPHGQWQENPLYQFGCYGDGKNPHGGVTADSAGNLYGTTVAGGSGGSCTGDGCGTVFELTPSGERVLYNFTGGKDGFGPGGGVAFDKAGNLYGTTPDGGAHSMGVVYQLSPHGSQWQQRVIHAFTGGKDGGVGSLGLLLIDTTGNLYGVTELGGANGAGTVYKMTQGSAGKWNLSTLYAFKGTPDAGFPYGGLIGDASGNLFGTTYFGGTSGQGAVFELRLNPKGRYTEHVLYNFQGGTDGSAPTSTLVFDGSGNLYGTTSAGGDTGCDCGTVFKLRHGSWKESIIHRFSTGSDGANPYYGLTPDANGNLAGAAVSGGAHTQGAIFEFKP